MKRRSPSTMTVLLAALLAGCGSTKVVTVVSTTTTVTPTTSVSSSTSSNLPSTATQTVSTTTPTLQLSTFKSPTGNIGCMLFAGSARCDIRQRTWSPPPRPASCPNVVDFGQGLALGNTGPGKLVCAGDTVQDPAAAVLPYGSATVADGFTCASASAGMTCTRSAHGFFISAQGYRAF